MKVLVTGSEGFIGKNLVIRLRENPAIEVRTFVRSDSLESIGSAIAGVDTIVHLAGENRPKDEKAFDEVNVGLTREICKRLRSSDNRASVIFASSTQAELDNPYGRSKSAAEAAVSELAAKGANPVAIYRLPGVFGKWCKPNYNSVVATFCHNIANDLDISISDPSKSIRIVYVDDVIASFINWIGAEQKAGIERPAIQPEYSIELGMLARQVEAFKNCRTSLVAERVGTGLTRALYATYVSYLPTSKFSYEVPLHGDQRGVFVEMLKTPDAGQFSYFTALPGMTRGSHYHHTKTEKFLVIKGKARFGFRHLVTGETHTLYTSGDTPQIVETVPGWVHDIKNVGDDEMVVMLWANEIFDRGRPDTIASKV